ncbi:MAG: thiol:disulfide interchange protein DsbA/DsbL [Pseudomonadota bacterium]
MRNLYAFIGFSLLIFSNVIFAADGYITISPAQPTQTGDKIEVVEVFWYGCPHCYDFEPYVEKWLETKPDDVELRRMPGVFRKSWIPHAKAFYAAEKMGVLDKVHQPIFEAMHKKRKKLNDFDALEDLFSDQGIDSGEFKKAYNSDEVDTKVKQAYLMGQRYKVPGTPAMIVNGKYLVSGSSAGSFENMIKVVTELADKERALAARE